MIGVIKHFSNWDAASYYRLGWQSLRQSEKRGHVSRANREPEPLTPYLTGRLNAPATQQALGTQSWGAVHLARRDQMQHLHELGTKSIICTLIPFMPLSLAQ